MSTKPAAKKPATKKPAAKKVAAKKPAAPKVVKPATPKVVKADAKPKVAKVKTDAKPKVAKAKTDAPKRRTDGEPQVLYTFRLKPSLIKELNARAAKEGLDKAKGHAEIARRAIAAYVG